MDVGNSVSRRTRSRWDAHFRSQLVGHAGEDSITGNVETHVIDDDDDSDDSSAVSNRKKRARRKNIDDLDDDDFAREIPVASSLPLKFKFEEDDSAQKKSEWEMEIEGLFHDLDVGLWESEAAAVEWSEEDLDQSIAARCSRGEHDELLDEQIGIICIYCQALLLDIKYVLPPFCVESPERSDELKINHEDCNINLLDDEEKEVSNKKPTLQHVPSSGTVFDLIPKSEEELYPHQLEGFEFMWRNIGGGINISSLQQRPESGARGCIISHAPGTGKTRLTILFLQTFMRLYPRCRPVIIAPRGMLLTWEHELNKWKAAISFHNLNEPKLSDEEKASTAVKKNISNNNKKKMSTDYIRSVKLLSWMRGGSILGVGYRLFEELADKKFKKVLLESPTLVVLDEGHTPRNHQSLMWKVLTKVATQRRIILSGTPFQNNFDELYNTLSLVNPELFQNQREWTNLTSNDEGIKKLRAMIQPFVHIHKCSILEKTLPGIRDWMVILKPTDLQQKLLKQNMGHADNLAQLASLISVHPSLVAEMPQFARHKHKLKSLESDPRAGVKTHFLINLIQLSSRINEKVLVFSEFIKPLVHLKTLLQAQFKWNEGREVMFIHGDLNMKQRQSLITSFNDTRNGEAKVLLASQKACGEGISLVGASRVVLLSVSWNPSVERQAICRAYRLGQQKMVYVYHLATAMEVSTKYARQTEKDRISDLIFSPRSKRPAAEGEEEENHPVSASQDKLLEAMLHHQATASMFQRIIHQPKDSHLLNNSALTDFLFPSYKQQLLNHIFKK